MGRAGGRGPGGRLGELSARGASLVAEAHQWTHLRGKLALGAVRGPRHGSGALGSGRLRSVRLVTCHSLQRRDQLPLLERWFLKTSVQWCQEWVCVYTEPSALRRHLIRWTESTPRFPTKPRC